METFFISKLRPFLDALAKDMDVYVPKKTAEYYTFVKYDPAESTTVELNGIRTCLSVKEFLFPIRELAATYPKVIEEEVKPFAVFGLKNCDLQAIEILDKVFAEEEFLDPSYVKRREAMFIISSDCFNLAESCFCSVFDGQVYSRDGFDLNISKIRGGFIVEAGSDKGKRFTENHHGLFDDAPKALLDERDQNRASMQKQLEEDNAELHFDASIRDIVENSQESEIFNIEAKTCVECQACTRVCPTCHCFYLYDTKQGDYFGKMKMWDSCVRMAYAEVAGGANPRNVLGDRIKHRLMHKFVYFLDRYGLEMCVGCGRCVDAEVGEMDLRKVLSKLYNEFKKKNEGQVKAER